MPESDCSWPAPAVVERPPDIVTVVDATGRRIYASPAVEAVFGYDPAALAGESAFDHVHPDDLGRLHRIFERGIEEDHQSDGAVFRYQAADGGWLVLESVGVNLLEDPRVGTVVIDTRDITNRVATPPGAVPADRPIGAGRFGILVLDSQSEVITVTEAVADLAGRPTEELVGSRFAEQLPEAWLEGTAPDGPLALLAGNEGDDSVDAGGVLELEDGSGTGGELVVSVVRVPAGPLPEAVTVVGVRRGG